jgi:hypothetical protein
VGSDKGGKLVPRWLKSALVIHLIADGILGALLLLLPGRFLSWLGWAPIDPIISRILGAALLAMSWMHLRLWRQTTAPVAAGDMSTNTLAGLWAQTQAIFETLVSLGLLRHLLVAHWPLMVWILFVLSVFSALLWLGVWLQERR